MAIVSATAIAARLRQAPLDRAAVRAGTPPLVAGLRLAGLVAAGSGVVALLLQLATRIAGASIADPLGLPLFAASPSPLATWGFVLYESALLPHAVPGSSWMVWGAGSLPLTMIWLTAAFRAGGRTVERPLDLLALVAPSLVVAVAVGAAEMLSGSRSVLLATALMVPVPLLLAAAAGAHWHQLRESGSAAPILRALMAAAFAVPAGIGLAALPVWLAPAGREVDGMWMWMLLPFAPNAILRGAVDGYGLADSVALLMLVTGATLTGLQLSPRSFSERCLYAVAVAGLLLASTVAATPVTGTGAWTTAQHSFSAALLVGIVGAVVGPAFGALGAGHVIARLKALQVFGDLLPPPAASEIEATGDLDIASAAAVVRLPSRQIVRPAGSGLRLPGKRHVGGVVAGAAAAVALLVAAAVAVTVIKTPAPSPPAPELSAARAYLEAAGTGDSARAWAAVAVDTGALPAGSEPRLLGKSDFERMLRLDANRGGAPTGLTLDLGGRSGSTALVHARYADAQGTHDLTLTMTRRGRAWKVLLQPAGLVLPSTAVARVSIDGAPVDIQATPVAVLPGVHQVRVDYQPPFQPVQALVAADRGYAQPVAAPVGAHLDDGAVNAARGAVAAAIRACLGSTAPHPTGCPQGIDAPAGSAVHWSLVGDPAQPLVVLPDDRGGVIAHGQFQMVGAYAVHVPEDTKHVAAGGSFRVSLAWSAGQWSVAGAIDQDSADVAQPAVAGADLLSAVRAGFNQCATSALLRPADCPQTVPSQLFVKDVAWRLASDPVAGAMVAFDAHRGVWSVSGSYAMTAAYIEGGQPKQASSGGRYRAELFWDATTGRPVLVAINRA